MKTFNFLGAIGMTICFGLLQYNDDVAWIIPTAVCGVIYGFSLAALKEE